jgi:hypothetical protein
MDQSPNGIPNPITVIVATLVTRPHEMRAMIGNGLKQVAGMGLQALARRVAQNAPAEPEPRETPDKEEQR